MNRAKLILSAIAIFAIIGGAMAFKARSFSVLYYPGVDSECTLSVRTSLAVVASGGTTGFYSTTYTSDPCPLTHYITAL